MRPSSEDPAALNGRSYLRHSPAAGGGQSLPRRPNAITVAFCCLWLQPLAISEFGLPLGSLAMAGVAALILLDHLRLRQRPRGLAGARRWLLAGALWVMVGLQFGQPVRHLYTWATLWLAVLVGVLVGSAGSSVVSRAVRRSALFGLTVYSGAVLVQRLVSPTIFGLVPPSGGSTRASSIASNPNAGAFYLMLGLLLVWHLRTHRAKGWRSLSRLGIVLVGAWALLETGSRSALAGVSIAAVLGIYWRTEGRGVRQLRTRALALCAAVCLTALYLASGSIVLDGVVAERTRAYAPNDRTEIWSEAASQINASPWFGTPTFVVDGYSVNNAHSAYLETGLRFGLPALVILVVTLCKITGALYRRRTTPLALAGLTTMIGAVVHSASHTGILDNALFWVIVAALSCARMPNSGSQLPRLASPVG